MELWLQASEFDLNQENGLATRGTAEVVQSLRAQPRSAKLAGHQVQLLGDLAGTTQLSWTEASHGWGGGDTTHSPEPMATDRQI